MTQPWWQKCELNSPSLVLESPIVNAYYVVHVAGYQCRHTCGMYKCTSRQTLALSPPSLCRHTVCCLNDGIIRRYDCRRFEAVFCMNISGICVLPLVFYRCPEGFVYLRKVVNLAGGLCAECFCFNAWLPNIFLYV